MRRTDAAATTTSPSSSCRCWGTGGSESRTAGNDALEEGTMPRLILKSNDRVLKDQVVGAMATIGRRPDNTIVFDDAAVSGHHACVFREGEDLIVEDLESTNGTFVNDKRVTRQRLSRGGVIAIGKHTLLIERVSADGPVDEDAAKGLMSN